MGSDGVHFGRSLAVPPLITTFRRKVADMSPLATIQDAQSRELVSEDRDVVELELQPGLSAQDLARFESKLPCAVPPSVRELFLKELFKLSEPPFASLVDDVHEDRLFDVWRANPGVKSYEECIGSGDDDLKTFAEELGPKFRVVDMRKPEIGFGFSWGRYGPNTVVRRYGMKPIFAYEQRRGFLSRLFGGSA